MRVDNPVTEDNGKKVGLERSNDNSESVSDVASDKTNIKYICETIKFLKNNGPILKKNV